MPNRPTSFEKEQKLKDAIGALNGKDGFFANPVGAAEELNDLDIGDSAEVWELIRKLLPEIKGLNYSGDYPPMRSEMSFSPVFRHEMYAYSWNSTLLGEKMYIKFVIKGSFYWYVRLHKDRPENQ